MYAEIDRDLKRAEEMREPFWAEYEENLSADALKRVIDFQNGRNLPSKAKLIVEIRRWLKKPTAAQKKTLTYGSKDELEALLAAALKHEPRRWLSGRDGARRWHKFDLSFAYKGPFPARAYHAGPYGRMDPDALKAMLEIHPDPSISITVGQLKAELRDRSERALPTGGRDELLRELRAALRVPPFAADGALAGGSEGVAVYADEKAARQAELDAERDAWHAELAADRGASELARDAQAARAKAAAVAAAARAERGAVFAGRKWAAPAYGGGADLDGEALRAARAKAEGEWAARHPQLNFPYSGARVPKAKWFREVLRDYLADKVANAHHLLACLSGNPWSKLQPHLDKPSLKLIHRQDRRDLGYAHQAAVQTLAWDVRLQADARFKRGV